MRWFDNATIRYQDNDGDRKLYIGGIETIYEKNIDVVFLSPPWGGPDYTNIRQIDIEKHIRVSQKGEEISLEETEGSHIVHGGELLKLAAAITNKILYFLPKNTNINSFANTVLGICESGSDSSGGVGNKFELVEECLNGKHKTTLAVFNL